MFYTGLPAYGFLPLEIHLKELKEVGRKIAVFKPTDRELPDYIKNDTTVVIIDQKLQGYD
jgi:hypothetical protein